MRDADGTEYRVPPVFNGAEGRYEDWTWLRMLEREWLRPVDADLYDPTPEDSQPSAPAGKNQARAYRGHEDDALS